MSQTFSIKGYSTSVVVLLLTLLCPSPFLAQNAIQDPLLGWMDQIAQEELQKRESEIAAVSNVADAKRRKQSVRAKLLEMIGGLPDYNEPLNGQPGLPLGEGN